MALYTLPVAENYPWFSFTCAADSVSYTWEMAFNVRSDRWVLTLGDVLGNVLIAGMPILIQRDLLGAYRHLAVPQGVLFAVDLSGKNQQPTLASFLQDHQLFYEGI